jgi:Zn-dependent protease
VGIDLAHIDWNLFLISMLAIVWSITFHEFSHAFAADRLGDDTPRRQGRVTLLPTEHFDPIGFCMLVYLQLGGVGLGWGKPVQVNLAVLRHPRRDNIIITAAGPFSNLCLAVVAGLLMRFTGLDSHSGLTGIFLQKFMFINLGLMLFNLIPIAPLDGSRILSSLLPFEQSVRYDRFMGQYGWMLLIGLVFFGSTLLSQILGPPMFSIAHALTGMGWGYA